MKKEIESDLHELKQLEDNDIEIKQKTKKKHKILDDEQFYRVKLPYNNHSKICRTKHENITNNSFVVIPTQYGPEIGIIQGKTTNKDEILSEEEIIDIIRIATKNDKNKYEENLEKEKKAYKIASEKIKKHKLTMKLVNTHYFFEESKILFNFTADGRIDFRDLVKDLASIFKTRIELRQIGIRDECRIMSGYGHCGRHFCCSKVNNDLSPITIKMAKEQNITLNSLKISGACNRLLCCLAYEYETYKDEKKNYPDEGAKIRVNNEFFHIAEINIQSKTAKLVSPNGRFHQIPLKLINYDKNKKSRIC